MKVKENKKRATKEMNKFSIWMQQRIKSIHCTNNEEMSLAYQKVYANFS